MRSSLLGALLFGQSLAILVACTAVCSVLLVRQGVSLPVLQSTANYLCLAIAWIPTHALRTRRRAGRADTNARRLLSAPVWVYALLALLDVEANACLVAAYRWTSMTSVQLLDAWTIPAVLVLSAWALKRVYGRRHYAGALLCVLGFGILVAFDARGGEAGGQSGPWEGRKPWVGDALTILGATLYAASNVLQERLLSHSTPTTELLGMLGLFGTIWSLVQGIIAEGSAASGAHWTRLAVMLPFIGFGAAMFVFYSLVPIALRLHGAALLNLSLLAADAWTGLARGLFLEGFPTGALVPFLACFAITGLGIITFVSGDAGANASHRSQQGGDSRLDLGGTTKQEQMSTLHYVEEGLELEHTRSDSETRPLIAPAGE